jgi:hypothetical protein
MKQKLPVPIIPALKVQPEGLIVFYKKDQNNL